MTPDAVERVLREYAALREPLRDPGLERIRLAVLVEDVFGVLLTDDDLGRPDLGDPAVLAELLASRGGAA